MSQGRQGAAIPRALRLAPTDPARAQSDAARKRAAIEMIAEHGGALKRTARRYSLDGEDAEDAYQRALEIVLTKAPTTDAQELIRWTQTVTKHEAIARSREALQALKPAELRALSLLAEGYSYAEIGELTGFSQTKINRVLAEGRDRFRSLVSSSEDGSRCRQLRPLLSAFCDGEVSAGEAETVREHLRACGRCRSTMRAYRAAPRIAIALAPALPPARPLLGRAHEFLAGLGSRLPGIGGSGADSAAAQIAVSGGSRGAGMVALAKLLALCAGAAGGAAACVATGVLPAPDLNPQHTRKPTLERSLVRPAAAETDDAVQYEPAPAPTPQPEPKPVPAPQVEAESASPEVGAAPAGAVEYEAPAAAPEESATNSAESSSGSPAGEFGP